MLYLVAKHGVFGLSFLFFKEQFTTDIMIHDTPTYHFYKLSASSHTLEHSVSGWLDLVISECSYDITVSESIVMAFEPAQMR